MVLKSRAHLVLKLMYVRLVPPFVGIISIAVVINVDVYVSCFVKLCVRLLFESCDSVRMMLYVYVRCWVWLETWAWVRRIVLMANYYAYVERSCVRHVVLVESYG